MEQHGSYFNSPVVGPNKFQGQSGREEFMRTLYANEPLLMQLREALRIRGFGFGFEKQYEPSKLEVADQEQTEDEAAQQGTKTAGD